MPKPPSRLRAGLRRILGVPPAAEAAAPRAPPRSREEPAPSAEEIIRAYQARTRHHPSRYARGPGMLDWEHQPDPFRRFEGAPLHPLDLAPPTPEPRFEPGLLRGGVAPRPLDRAAISQLFMDALALSAWKQAGDARWSLRVDPSSGNLHPTEGWLLAPALPGLWSSPAVLHYRPDLHALEERCRLSETEWAALSRGLPPGAVLVGLTSIWWRESWKYGERAWRYCQLDLGHCLGTLAAAAGGLGWEARLLVDHDDDWLAAMLGVGRPAPGQPVEEQDQPEALLVLAPPVEGDIDWSPPPAPPAERFLGRPAPLSSEVVPWPVIEEAARAGRRVSPGAPRDALLPQGAAADSGAPLGLRTLVHQRRSAVAMDGRTGISRDAFLHTCRKLVPAQRQLPWTTLPWRPRVHLALMVHRVADVEPGLYLLARHAPLVPELRGMLDPTFRWRAVDPELPLYLLQEGDLRGLAQGLSCGQDIASDGVFAVAMLGELRQALADFGAWGWRALHWEAGLVGQQLYLEAEATGIRGTGIGCFHDEPTHQVLLRPEAWRREELVDLYHFTVGGPVEDTRLQTLPPYADREAALARARQVAAGEVPSAGETTLSPPHTPR